MGYYMRDKDTILLEEFYTKISENDSVLIPRRSPEERVKYQRIAINKQVQEYIKNGSKGDLELDGKPIISLPDNLKTVGRNLDLYKTQIQSLPEGLKVGGMLDVSGTSIQSLPNGLSVGGSLYLSRTSIQSLPEDLEVAGGLDLESTPLQSLPKGLSVGRTLNLVDTPIQSLPEGLKIGTNLTILKTQIQSLPEDLEVGGMINLSNTPISRKYSIEELDQMYPHLKGQFSD